MRDPIAELLEDLTQHGSPSLAWTLRWGQGGVDPVLSAWNASRSPQHMVALLQACRHPRAADALATLRAPLLFANSDSDRVRSDALRRLVCTPPAFEQLERARR